MADYIYLGPTSTAHGLENGKIYKGSIPASVANLASVVPAVSYLVVNISDRSRITQELKQKGSAADVYYKSIADGSAFRGLGGGGVVTPGLPDLKPWETPFYTTPAQSIFYDSAGNKRNFGDALTNNGALRVVLATEGSEGLLQAFEFTPTGGATAAGSKQYVAEGVKIVTIEIYGSAEGATANFTAYANNNGRRYALQGVKQAGGEIDIVGIGTDAASIIKPGMIVEFTKPAGSALELQWTAPTGGKVYATAKIR